MGDAFSTALRDVPDLPRWIEARSMLLQRCCGVYGGPGGWVLRNEQRGARLICVVGRPDAEALALALRGRLAPLILCAPEDEAVVLALLPGWTGKRTVLNALVDPGALAPPSPEVRLLTTTDALDHLDEELAEEVGRAVRDLAVHAAFDEGLPASFAYAYWKTETLFDLAIDTAADHRRRGLARRAASALIREQGLAGRRPVWGALEDNPASQRLAEGLGFAPDDAISLLAPP